MWSRKAAPWPREAACGRALPHFINLCNRFVTRNHGYSTTGWLVKLYSCERRTGHARPHTARARPYAASRGLAQPRRGNTRPHAALRGQVAARRGLTRPHATSRGQVAVRGSLARPRRGNTRPRRGPTLLGHRKSENETIGTGVLRKPAFALRVQPRPPGHSQILSREIKSGSGLGTRLPRVCVSRI